MRDTKHILLPTDFSENSRTAFPAGVALARDRDATLHLLHVVSPLPWPAHRVLETENFPGVYAEIHRRCEKRLREVSSELGEVRTEVHVVEGKPAEEVRRFVEDRRIDLVALSTKGSSNLKRYMLGSVAEKIVRTVPCPVLVVRETPRSWDRLSKIVVPTDFSELSDLAVDQAVELARKDGAQIVLTHVLEETDYPMGHVLKGHGILDVREQTRTAAQSRLEELRAEKIAPPITASVVVREGVASATIADLAEEEGADLVVIATNSRRRFARFVLGSTAERVVRVAPCSVLVVREREM